LRVLYFSRDYTPHDYRFLTSLAESGQEVFFLRLERAGSALDARALPPEVRQVRWRGGQTPFQWKMLPALLVSLRGVLRTLRPQVFQAGPIQTAGFLAALSGYRPLAATSWGSDLLLDADRSSAYQRITRYTLSRADVLLGDCRAVARKAADFGFPEERSFLFPWGIDLCQFSPNSAPGAEGLRARLGWQNCFVILSLRSWEPVYGVDVLLRGFAAAYHQMRAGSDQAPPLRLLLLGNGSQAPLLHRIIEENGLRDAVHLGGRIHQEDLPELYRAADLYASASHSDGSSVSLMEALGSGLPVLVSDIPGNREWVTEGQEGWLFPDGDDRALGAQIAAAVRQPELLAQMRLAARALAERRADWKKNFQTLLAGYRFAAARSRGQKAVEEWGQ
jgi:glycosyltransferase involved in cell wall biosynthesis